MSEEHDDAALRRVLRAAARELNAGRFFDAHEALEEALDDAPDALWPLFLGLIQVAVGYHKRAHDFPGGERMLALGFEKLAPLPDDALGFDLASFRARAEEEVEAARVGRPGPASLEAHPPRLLPVARRGGEGDGC